MNMVVTMVSDRASRGTEFVAVSSLLLHANDGCVPPPLPFPLPPPHPSPSRCSRPPPRQREAHAIDRGLGTIVGNGKDRI